MKYTYTICDANGNFIKNDLVESSKYDSLNSILSSIHGQNEISKGYTIEFTLLGKFLVEKSGWSRIVSI